MRWLLLIAIAFTAQQRLACEFGTVSGLLRMLAGAKCGAVRQVYQFWEYG